VVHGALISPRFCINRVCLALDLITHVVLEHGVMDNVWSVECDLRDAARVLTDGHGTPERLLRIFSIRRRKT
jgi:hypothetical protein